MFSFFIKSLLNLSRNSVRFENCSGNWLSDGLNSVRFISECEIWHVCTRHDDTAFYKRGNYLGTK